MWISAFFVIMIQQRGKRYCLVNLWKHLLLHGHLCSFIATQRCNSIKSLIITPCESPFTWCCCAGIPTRYNEIRVGFCYRPMDKSSSHNGLPERQEQKGWHSKACYSRRVRKDRKLRRTQLCHQDCARQFFYWSGTKRRPRRAAWGGRYAYIYVRIS